MQQQGYDKLSEDTQKTLDDTVKAIQGNADQQEKIVKLMLDRVKANYKTAYGEIDKTIAHTGTTVSKSTTDTINDAKANYSTLIESIKTNITGAFTALPSEVTKAIETSPINIKVTFGGMTIDQIEAKLKEWTGKEVNDQKPQTNTPTTNTGGTSGGSSNGKKDDTKTTETVVTQRTAATTKVATPAAGLIDPKDPSKGYKTTTVAASSVSPEIKTTKKATGKGTDLLDDEIFVVPKKKETTADKLKKEQKAKINEIKKRWQQKYPHSGTLSKTEQGYNDLYKYIATKWKVKPHTDLYKELALAMGMTGLKYDAKKDKYDEASRKKILTKLKSYSRGTLGTKKDELSWTHQGEIIRRSDGAILRQLPAGTQVVPKIESANLMKWGAIDPNKFFADALRSMSASSNVSTNTVVNNYDALIKVEGDVNADVMDRLENLAQQLLNNRTFQNGTTNIVTKNLTREMGKMGYKR